MVSKRARLAQRRKTAGYSQEELAERLGVDRSTIVRWETAETEPQPWVRPKLATVLRITATELQACIDDVVVDQAPTSERPDHALQHPSSVDLVAVAYLQERVRPLDESYDRAPSTERGASTPPARGARLRSFREADRRETREEFAAAIGCDARLLARWERGEVHCPRPFYRRRLAELEAPLPRPAMHTPRAADSGTPSLDESSDTQDREMPGDGGHGAGGEDPTRRRDLFRAATLAGAASLPASALHNAGEGRRVLQALDVMNHSCLGAVVDSLGELIDYYALATCTMSPAVAYDELLSVRSYIDGIFECGKETPDHAGIMVASGWFSNLLAIAACDMGEHAAARIWCVDAERQSCHVGHPELAAWAVLTRSMIAFYRGQPRNSADLSSRGQRLADVGTVAHAKLAAQEMRAAALVGDADRMVGAKDHATDAIAKLPDDAGEQSGVFSIPVANDPPYTATSLLLLGRFGEAVSATTRVIQTVYQPEARHRGDHPSGYARSLLILGLAQAGIGDLDGAVSAGSTALSGSRPAWPTLVLAGKLNRVLQQQFANAAETKKYRTRYEEVASAVTTSASDSSNSFRG